MEVVDNLADLAFDAVVDDLIPDNLAVSGLVHGVELDKTTRYEEAPEVQGCLRRPTASLFAFSSALAARSKGVVAFGTVTRASVPFLCRQSRVRSLSLGGTGRAGHTRRAFLGPHRVPGARSRRRECDRARSSCPQSRTAAWTAQSPAGHAGVSASCPLPCLPQHSPANAHLDSLAVKVLDAGLDGLHEFGELVAVLWEALCETLVASLGPRRE